MLHCNTRSLGKNDRVKYLGVFLDDTISFRHHISYVASRISRSNGIIANFRHFFTLSQMRQLYYSIIYPYISYAILAWGSAYKSHINKIQTKQNHAIRLTFFARKFGKQTESALPLLINLLDVLTVNNVYRLHTLKFTHLWHKVFTGITPDMLPNKIYINQKSEPTLENKQLPLQQLFSGMISQYT